MAAQFYSLYHYGTGIIAASYKGDSHDDYTKVMRMQAHSGMGLFEATELLDPQKWLIKNGAKVARLEATVAYMGRNGNFPDCIPTEVIDGAGHRYELHVQGGDLVQWENLDMNPSGFGDTRCRVEGPVINGLKIDTVSDYAFDFKVPAGPGEYDFTFTIGSAPPGRVKIIAHQVLAQYNSMDM